MNTKDYLAVEKRDLTQAVTLVSPTRTPFSTLLMAKGVSRATDTEVKWRVRELAAGRSARLKEGADAPAPTTGTRKVLSNYTQIIAHTASVTESAANIEVFGYDSTLQQDEIDNMIKAKLDLNYFAINGVKADEDATSGRAMGGILALAEQKQAVDGALTFDVLAKAMQTMFKSGAEGAKFALMNSETAMWIDKLPEINAKNYQMQLQVGANAVEIFVTKIMTRFGEINVMIDEDMPANEIVLFDTENIELTALYPFSVEPLAKTGLTQKSLIAGEYSLKLLNDKSAVHLTGITAPVVPAPTASTRSK